MKNLKGGVFDLDETLVMGAERLHYLGWVEALKTYGVHFTKKDYLTYAGKTGNVIDEELIRGFGLGACRGDLLLVKDAETRRLCESEKIELMPHAPEAVEFFKRRRLKTAVASGAPRKEAEEKLRKTGLLSKFDVVITRDDVSRGKPYPDAYLMAADKLEIEPELLAGFDDTQYGIESQQRAGIGLRIAVPTEYSEHHDFSKAHEIFDSLRGAIEYLERSGLFYQRSDEKQDRFTINAK
ncbi:MAG: HAD family phosphatase [Candidatus Aenigmarchaeota archaeon]|nr:HAD family phosphatase [Candidatus Aenigmarchaeota archaeon]